MSIRCSEPYENALLVVYQAIKRGTWRKRGTYLLMRKKLMVRQLHTDENRRPGRRGEM